MIKRIMGEIAKELIKSFLLSPFGSFGFGVGLVLAVMFLVYWVTKHTTCIKKDHSILYSQLHESHSYIDDIRRDISYIKGTIDMMQRNYTDGLTQRNSPISLTELGKKEVVDFGLDRIVERNWDTIYHQMELDVASKNPYDVQTYCIETAATEPEKFFTQNDILMIKEIAFKKGLALMSYTNILGVLIRDKYFKQKNIKIEEIDKHDPHITQND